MPRRGTGSISARYPLENAAKTVTDNGNKRSRPMNSIIYIIGLVVVVLFILSFLGLR